MNEQKRIERKLKFIEEASELYNGRYDYSKASFLNAKTKIEICCTKHAHTFNQTPQMHLRGSGCKQCQSEKLSRAKTKTKEQFISEATAIHGNKYNFDEIVYEHSHKKIYPLCKVHGKFETTASIILMGSGCAKCASESQQIPFKDLKEQFKMIHGDNYSYDEAESEYYGAYKKIPIKCLLNEAHGIFWQNPKDHKQGKGCPKCSNSKGEEKVCRILDKNNISYEREGTFHDLRGEGGGKLKFDFMIDETTLIEYDGQQHYEHLEFFTSKSSFETLQEHDKRKNEYCERNGLTLLRIPYTMDAVEIEKQIMKLIN